MLKKLILQSFIFSLAVLLVFIGFQIIMGLIMTKMYTPSITDAYQSVNTLQKEVSFGVANESAFGSIHIFIISMVLYIGLGFLYKKLKQNKAKGNNS